MGLKNRMKNFSLTPDIVPSLSRDMKRVAQTQKLKNIPFYELFISQNKPMALLVLINLMSLLYNKE